MTCFSALGLLVFGQNTFLVWGTTLASTSLVSDKPPTPTLVVTMQVSQLQITALIWNQGVPYVTSSRGSQHPPRDDFLT